MQWGDLSDPSHRFPHPSARVFTSQGKKVKAPQPLEWSPLHQPLNERLKNIVPYPDVVRQARAVKTGTVQCFWSAFVLASAQRAH